MSSLAIEDTVFDAVLSEWGAVERNYRGEAAMLTVVLVVVAKLDETLKCLRLNPLPGVSVAETAQSICATFISMVHAYGEHEQLRRRRINIDVLVVKHELVLRLRRCCDAIVVVVVVDVELVVDVVEMLLLLL